jgi:hypothetical protein
MYIEGVNLLPDKDNNHILELIRLLDIKALPFYVEIKPELDAINGSCFINVKDKIAEYGGEEVLGWQFIEYTYMIEAEFHSIWRTPEGQLLDITPPSYPVANQILFIIDLNKKYLGVPTDNARINTTSNKLVDDIIEIEKVKFEIQNHFYDSNGIIKSIISDEAQLYWNLINFLSIDIYKYYEMNGSVKNQCYCNSGKIYNNCHRISLKELINKIRSL